MSEKSTMNIATFGGYDSVVLLVFNVTTLWFVFDFRNDLCRHSMLRYDNETLWCCVMCENRFL